MKKSKIVFWIATCIIFLYEGAMPMSALLFFPDQVNAGTKPLGYPDYFAVALIIFKFLGAASLVITRLPGRVKEWAYAGLAFNLIFAIISHLVVHGLVFFSFFPLIVAAILSVSYYYNRKIYNRG